MSERIPVNPGEVEWSGDNPGIYLRHHVDGPWTSLAVLFNIVYSPHGRGFAMIVLGDPDVAGGFPEARNACITDNEEMTRYLIRDYLSKFPSFRGQAGLEAMSWHALDRVERSGDMKASWTETAHAEGLALSMTWRTLGEPFPVEVAPENCATGAHDMYSVFFEAADAGITINDQPLDGKVTDRLFFGRQMSTAFLAVSETWVTPAKGA